MAERTCSHDAFSFCGNLEWAGGFKCLPPGCQGVAKTWMALSDFGIVCTPPVSTLRRERQRNRETEREREDSLISPSFFPADGDGGCAAGCETEFWWIWHVLGWNCVMGFVCCMVSYPSSEEFPFVGFKYLLVLLRTVIYWLCSVS